MSRSPKISIILITITLIIVFVQLQQNYNGGCPPDAQLCMGPTQIEILGSPFSNVIILSIFIPLALGLVAGLIISALFFIFKNNISDVQLINILVLVFSIVSIVFMLLQMRSVSNFVY